MDRRRALMLCAGATGTIGLPSPAIAQAGSPKRSRSTTMLEMTFPEFEAACARTDICLLPIGSIEEHGPHLPLNTDGLGAIAQLQDVQAALASRAVPTLIGPCLNIGITNEGEDDASDGTSIYPGSLTIGFGTFVDLYVDLLRSLHRNGLKQIFLYSGHLGGKHLRAVAQAAIDAREKVSGLKAWALIDSERLARLELPATGSVLPIEQGLNFPMLKKLLGGSEPAFTTHADGWETSLMLHQQSRVVREGYADLPQVSSPQFIAAQQAGDRRLNPIGIGGFPTRHANAAIGKQIADYRTGRIVAAIANVLSR
jgi:creatinine amidohydrolase